MCIIVYKPVDTKAPSWKTLKACFDYNPNGCGFMYAENGNVHIHKGFMSWRGFKTAFKPFKNREDIPIVLHFRITTNGATCPQNTHPFPLTEKVGELKELDSICEVGIAHNGIIPLTANAEKMSDTMEFIRTYGRCIIHGPKWYENKHSGEILASVIESKMLVLSNDGHAEVVGTGWVKDEGIYYSNSTYKPYLSKYAGYYNSWDDDDDYTWYYASNKTKTRIEDDKVYDDDGRYYPTWCAKWDEGEPDEKCIECEHGAWCWGNDIEIAYAKVMAVV